MTATGSGGSTRARRIVLTATIIATVYSIVQRTPWAPFPHRADSFVFGVAIGSAIVLIIAILAARRENQIPLIVAFALVLAPFGNAHAQSTEDVLLESVTGDTAIVVRGISSRYRIEKGIGCISLDRYEGHRVAIVSPGFFLGVGSTLRLSDVGQECRIWDSRELPDSGTGGTEDVKVTTRVAVALTAAALGIAYLMSRR